MERPSSKRREGDCVSSLSVDEAIDAEKSVKTDHGVGHETFPESGDFVHRDRDGNSEPRHNVFLSHCGAQKDFAEQLCLDLEKHDQNPFFDKRQSSLPIGETYPNLIFDAIQQCQVGVLILSEEFFSKSKWPMVELVALVKELKKASNSSKKIIPVFYCISRKEWLDFENRSRWILQWKEWASKDPRINVEEWKMALEVLSPINSLEMINGMGEVNLRKRIVTAILNLVQSEIRLDISYIQGRTYLCEVVEKHISQQMQPSGICVIGLYGIGGIGKTTICKAMCNEMFQKFDGKVCHIELKNSSKIQQLHEVLKKLIRKRPEMLEGLNFDQCHSQLKRHAKNQAVFLAIDNVSDHPDVIKQAKTYLEAKWSKGSVIMVTARSLADLLHLRQYINENDCMEMPELTEEDAMSLFLNHATANKPDAASEMDKDELELVKHCVERCSFSKGTGGRHYIPLALEVLGQELFSSGYDAELWDAKFKKIDMFEEELSGNKHPIFSILRTSYDSLHPKTQMLFMDVALFLPCIQYQSWHWGCFLKCNLFKWLSMVHGSSIKEIRKQLEYLKQKSLLENLGNGRTKIGMHDLWLEFCVAETKVRNFCCGNKSQDQRWVFLEQQSSEFSCSWKNPVQRMCFLNEGWRALEEVGLEDYENVSVLKLNIGWFVQPSKLNLNLKGLKHLKSIELKANKFFIDCVGFGSLRNLLALKWWSDKASSPCIEEIGCLTKLQVLEIKGFDGANLPDLGKLTSLQVVCFAHCDNVVTITGLCSNLSNLRCLCISRCLKLQECPGLGELYDLKKLDLWGCKQLRKLPSLGLLTKLKCLNISECELVREVPGLSDLTTLKDLRATGCYGLGLLPDMHKLSKLEVLRFTDFVEMDSLDLGEFPRLEEWISGWCRALKSVTCSKCLCGLTVIDLTLCMSLEELPDLCNFPNLEELFLGGCACLMCLTSSSPLFALRILDLEGCRKMSALPDNLSISVDLRVLRLQKSGIVLSEEDIMTLEASCKSLVVFRSSDPSKYGDDYRYSTKITEVTTSDTSEDEFFDDMETNVQNQCRSRRVCDPLRHEKITRLKYSLNQREGEINLLALTSSGMHKRWDLENQTAVKFAPQLWRPAGGVLMINDMISTHAISEEDAPCSMALCRDDYHLYMLSASGGNVSFFTMMTDKEAIQQALPSTATFLAFYPQDNDILAIGMEDSTIAICNEYEKKMVCTLKGHQDRITGLAFSKLLGVLVSLGADAQLCVWRTNRWARRQLNFVQGQPDGASTCVGAICVQFHSDQVHLLVVCKSRLDVYRAVCDADTSELNLFRQWDNSQFESPFTAAISDATYSCDSQLVYVGFADGSVGIFDAKSLRPRSRLASPIHAPIPRGVSGSTAYPTTIAANPVRRNEFALGMSDGDVLVVEPLDAEWGDEETAGEENYESADEALSDDSEDVEQTVTKDSETAHYNWLDFFSDFFHVGLWRDRCLQFLTKVSPDLEILGLIE